MNNNSKYSNEKVKKHIIQEIQVQKTLSNLSFSEEDILTILSDLKIDFEAYDIDISKIKEILVHNFNPSMSRLYYDSNDDRNREPVQKEREFDFKYRFFHIDKKNQYLLISQNPEVTHFYLLGDVKDNSDYKWEFIRNNYFRPPPYPFYFEGNLPENKSHAPFIWNDDFPLPFHVAEWFQTRNRATNVIENDAKPSALDSTILKLKEVSLIGGIKENYAVLPMIVTSSKPTIIKNIPPEQEDFQEVDAVIYYFQPSTIQKAHNRYLVPILIIHQEELEQVIKKLLVALVANYSAKRARVSR